jgi:biotin carboxyl carrier protein
MEKLTDVPLPAFIRSPATVTAVRVRRGDQIKRDQPLCVVQFFSEEQRILPAPAAGPREPAAPVEDVQEAEDGDGDSELQKGKRSLKRKKTSVDSAASVDSSEGAKKRRPTAPAAAQPDDADEDAAFLARLKDKMAPVVVGTSVVEVPNPTTGETVRYKIFRIRDTVEVRSPVEGRLETLAVSPGSVLTPGNLKAPKKKKKTTQKPLLCSGPDVMAKEL